MSMTLPQLKRSRTSRQTIISKLIAELKDAIDSSNLIETERLLAHLELKEAALHGIAQQLEIATTDDNELDAAILENNAFADTIVDIKVLAHRLLAQSRVPMRTQTTSQLPAFSSTTKSTTKLPKLLVKKFDGAIQDWERFYDQFKAGVDDNTSLSEVDKFNYLKGFLTENASLTIAGLALTAANYDIAKTLLLKKYGQQDVLVSEHVKQLLEVRKITKLDNGQELRLLLETFQTHLRSLENLGKSVSSMGTLLCPTLLRSLPNPLIREWHRKTQGSANDNLNLLLDFIRSEVEGIELAHRNIASTVAPSIKEKRRSSGFDSNTTSASTLLATGDRNRNSPKQGRSCLFCESVQHFSSKCPECQTVDERKERLRKQKRCFRCLWKFHFSKPCERTLTCFFCKGTHPTLLCDRNKVKGKSDSSSTSTAHENTFPKTVAQSESSSGSSKTLIASAIGKTTDKTVSVLQTIRVWVRHTGGLHQVVLLLDGGSERTFVCKKLVRQLDLPCQRSEALTVHSFGGGRHTQKSNRIALSLVGQNEFSVDITALEVNEICAGVTLWESSQIESYLQSHKQRFNWNQAMGSGESVSVDILVGADFYWKIVTGHMKRLSPLLMATETVFGWTLQGNADDSFKNKPAISLFVATENSELSALNDKLTQVWELDRSGIMAIEEQSIRTLQDEEVLQRFQDTTSFIDNRYQVNIPWNQDKPYLCNNFALSKKRLKGLIMKLQQNPPLLERYRQGIYEYLKNQHTEEVEPNDNNGPIYVMPHHPIIKEDRKTTKLRIVFDASSHDFSGKSLNQCQYTGPNLNPTIFDLLLRFRWHRIGVTSDVEKAFLQVQLKPEDRNATRFLWTDEEWKEGSEPKLKTFRMTRVLFGMKASPYLLASTIRYHVKQHQQEYPLVSSLIDNNCYVDDFLSGSHDTEQALFVSTQAKELMDKASMPLKKWATNDVQLRKQWAELGMVSLDEPIELLKVLGLMWDPSTDFLSFKTTELFKALESSQATKRSILEILARVFDPLGMLTPKLVTLKLLLQDLWRLKIPWDEKIPDPQEKTWETWKTDVHLLNEFRIERWYSTSDKTILNAQMHVFCDASLKAFGAVAYLRFQTGKMQYNTVFIASKARISPLKLMSIPRLELLACVLGARLAASLLKAWSQEALPTFFWTDSQVTLQWIVSTPSRWKIFVARRVQEIQSLTKQNAWHYCISKENPADILSRGQTLLKLADNKLWWKGPKWLSFMEEFVTKIPVLAESEIEQFQLEEVVSLITTIEEKKEDLFDPFKYSRWRTIVRISAWIFRFLRNCRKIRQNKEFFLTIKEIQNAELYWLKQLQGKSFPKEIQLLKENRPLEHNSRLLQFQPFLDRAGTMRIGGRLQQANFSKQQTNPVLLRGGGIIDLFILDRHEKTLHGGIQSTLLKLREDVWLLKGRQAVRKAINGCRNCKKWVAKPVDVVEAPLPEVRITRASPFEVCGIDFAGPIWTKIAKEKTKSYICLFTCAVTRNVHLELTQSQGIKHFLWALRRFIARRGSCRTIISDNAGTFLQTERLLRESLLNLQHPEIQEFSVQQGIEWNFIMPRAPWWGGFYERMVGSVKRHLRRTLGSSLMVPEELATLLCEIESVVNARPLTPLTEDPRDSAPLTPSHFLLGRKGDTLTDILPSLNTIPVKATLLKKWQYRKRLMDSFWRQWSKEYLLQLLTAHKLSVPLDQPIVKLGDVVLLREDKLPRGQWKIARVEELFTGVDGKIRSLLLRTPNGTPLRRAVQRVCPLEVA